MQLQKIIDQPNEEVNFIRRKYCFHILQLICTFIFIAFILELDIGCVLVEQLPTYMAYTILELFFCLIIFILACLELRYFFKIKQNNFFLSYSSIISKRYLDYIIAVLTLIWLANLIFTIIYAIDVIIYELQYYCHYFDLKNQYYEIAIAITNILGQAIMMCIPIKIRKTLILLDSQQRNLLKQVLLLCSQDDQLDITPKDGQFIFVQTSKEQNKRYFCSLEIHICKICTYRFKQKQIIIKLSCSHLFHEQCFNKYAQNVMNKSFVITCQECKQGVQNEKNESFIFMQKSNQ